jgi:hypothetical protein
LVEKHTHVAQEIATMARHSRALLGTVAANHVEQLVMMELAACALALAVNALDAVLCNGRGRPTPRLSAESAERRTQQTHLPRSWSEAQRDAQCCQTGSASS